MKALFGGIIAYVLLALYAASVLMAISLAIRNVPKPHAEFTDGFNLAMTTVGALVSSLVISVLAVTDTGQAPLKQALEDNELSARQLLTAQIATYFYLAIWLICGLGAFIVGEMIYPKALQPLTDHGRAWIGLAVSVGYAYFGLKKTDR